MDLLGVLGGAIAFQLADREIGSEGLGSEGPKNWVSAGEGTLR